ncbi:MAG TPA: PQQ-binding-like beta-propeller repeat protein [Gemmatimonadales bacterium]|nr:PQQ-binding-like beta-propeller repeat protein [Gemmatimonadales bacterium]
MIARVRAVGVVSLVTTLVIAAGCGRRDANRDVDVAVAGSDSGAAGDTGNAAKASAAGDKTAAGADAALRAAMGKPESWPSYGRDYTNQRYSPLGQITAANVGGLTLAWRYHTGIPHAFEASPVVMDGVMYVSTPLNHVVALDARTGEKRWEFADTLSTTIHCCGAVNRGVAVYGGRVYMGTLDGRLVALDARTGRKQWDVVVGENDRGYAVDGAPVAADGKVIVGVSGAEYGIRGFVTAYDAATGRQVWRFYTIPSPAEGGWWGKWAETDAFGTNLNRDIAREKADSARYADAWKTGGGSVWQAPAVDRDLGLVIFSVGNASPDLDYTVRPGDNLYTCSIVAVDLKTGKLKWYFQELPHDAWDLDAISPVVLMDVTDASGATVKAVAQAGKTGWVYVVDRATGKPIRRSDAFVPQQNIFARPTPMGVRMLPGANGGSEWSAPAYSPETGYLYVLGLHQPMYYKLEHEPLLPPAFWLGGAFFATGEPQYGLFTAVDLNTGKIAWQSRVADPMIGGALATAGGVVFTGTKDQQVLAYDARTGRQLWSYKADAGVNAPPITYAVNGVQYVAVAAGGNYQINAPRGDEVLVFRLDSAQAARGT